MTGEPALLAALRSRRRHEGRIEAVHVAPESAATLGPWPPGLHPALLEAAAGLGIEALYEHQSRAVAAVLAGDSIVVATGTASGKSLCYLLPTLDALLRDEAATALYLFPTKALGRDQLDELGQWAARLPRGTVAAAAYDGDTPPGDRRRARAGARILVTNPDMLHAGILPHHPRWERLMAGLRLVVVDEMHVFRGVFGSHVANVLRRLRRVARHYGADPTFVLTSATVANPGDLGAVLAGGPVRVVDQDTAPHGRRALVFYNPPIVNDQLNLRRSAVLEAADIARLFLAAGVQTILFARTRHTTELLVRYVADGQPGTVRGY
ncbi:MAG: DEAD/DEAH box helicase, partial [Anaerolineae bacterium]